jgi:hypothetical protein
MTSPTTLRRSARNSSLGGETPLRIGTLATFQPCTARYMLKGVFPHRETPTMTISADGMSSGLCPSSWSTAKSIASIRS